VTAAAPRRARASAARDRERFPYRMRDLCARTGLPRQVIHFYIQQGLVPEGRKVGRNMAYYGDEHVERVRLVRTLQHERFLPLRAIRALLEARGDAFSPAQRRLLREVESRLGPTLGARRSRPATVDAEERLAQLGLERDDLDGLLEAGLLAATHDAEGRPRIAADDVWMLERWAELRQAGFTRELGFEARDLAILDEGVSAMFAREVKLLVARLAPLPPERVATMVERALPLINDFLARCHTLKARSFFASP
jgi:DNA-binding transcriptional MerR regulator